MATFNFNNTVPNGPDDPADDQPFMLTNTQSISGLINTEHVGFSLPNGGIHRKVTMPQNGGIPATSVGQLVLYNDKISPNTISQLIYSRENSGTQIPMIGPTDPKASQNGYVYLLGGILLQWGYKSFSGTSTTVTYADNNINMPNATFIVNITSHRATATSSTAQVSAYSLSNTSFKVNYTGSPDYDAFYWIAIGN